MKEIKAILSLYDQLKSSNEKSAIAQVVRVEESSYRREGARMIVFESGVFEGGISGGCLEGDALRRSQTAILKAKPSIVTYDTSKDDENQIGVGLGCNGIIDVLISPITVHSSPIPLLEKCVNSRQSHIIVTITSSTVRQVPLGTSFYFNADKQTIENFNNNELNTLLIKDIHAALEYQKSKVIHYSLAAGSVAAFIEFIPAPYHLAIYGDNYDVYPILDLARLLDWKVSLVGNIQKLKKEKLSKVNNIYDKEEDLRPVIDSRTAVVLMAHDYKTDVENLKTVLKSDASYIASLGPKKRFDKIENEFAANNSPFTKDDLKRIYAPCGLEIGANNPEEIALSIITEIIAVFSSKKGGMLREKKGPIHER